MSDDTQKPIEDLENDLRLEQTGSLEASAEIQDIVPAPNSELIEEEMLDESLDDFSDEYAEGEDADLQMESGNDDSAPYDYDGEVDEEFEPTPKRERENSYGKRKTRKNSLASELSFSEDNEFDGDNDPSPGTRPQQQEHTGPAKFAPQRLAKILAAAGIDARRKCEELVTTGRVSVDGKVITDVAFRADPYSQKIELDGEKLKVHRKVYFVLNKPRGVVCTNFDPAGKPRVIDLFPQFKERIFAIGRLDEESEGLLLVTNDGELANRMAHPRYRVPKFYLCHVKGVPSSETLAELKRGMYFEEGRFSVEGARMKKVVGDSSYLDIVLNEGQNREIRRLLARVNHKVMRLKRVGFGPIRLGDLPIGAFRQLTTPEVALLTDLSQQRAHLDNTAGRGRKKKFGEKPRFGKKPFGARSESSERSEFSSEGRPPRKSNYGRPASGTGSRAPVPYGDDQSFGDRPPRQRFVSQSDDESFPSFDNDETAQGDTRQRRPQYRTQPGDNSQGHDDQAGPRRYRRRGDNQQLEESQERPRRYSQGNREDRPPAQRRYSSGGYSPRSQRGYQPDQTGEPFQSQSYQRQLNENDGDFNGGRRRFVTDDTPESSFTRRPPAQGRAPTSRRRTYNDQNASPPAGGYSTQRRPQRRRTTNDDQYPPQSGGYSAQRRPARGIRPYGQAGNRELPARVQRGARPPKPMTADGKEILEGRITGYRSLTKDGPARRRRKPIQGMQVNRQQRQQKRKKSEE